MAAPGPAVLAVSKRPLFQRDLKVSSGTVGGLEAVMLLTLRFQQALFTKGWETIPDHRIKTAH